MVCIPCLECWIDESLAQVRQTALAANIDPAMVDLYQIGEELLEAWDVRLMIPTKTPHDCDGGDCRCRCRELNLCQT